MSKRLNITVSFSRHKELYNHVASQPNSSYYIRKLVEEDMNKSKTNKKANTDQASDSVKEIAIGMLDW